MQDVNGRKMLRNAFIALPFLMLPTLLTAVVTTLAMTKNPWCGLPFIPAWYVVNASLRWSISALSSQRQLDELRRKEPMFTALAALLREIRPLISKKISAQDGRKETEVESSRAA